MLLRTVFLNTISGTVRIFDFVRNEELVSVKYRQGGTALTWGPLEVSAISCIVQDLVPAAVKRVASPYAFGVGRFGSIYQA